MNIALTTALIGTTKTRTRPDSIDHAVKPSPEQRQHILATAATATEVCNLVDKNLGTVRAAAFAKMIEDSFGIN